MPWNFICSLVFAMISSFDQQKSKKKKKITFSIQQKKKEDINKRMVSTLWDIYCLLHNIIPQNYSQWYLDTSIVCKCPQLHIRSPDTPLHVLHQATNEQKQFCKMTQDKYVWTAKELAKWYRKLIFFQDRCWKSTSFLATSETCPKTNWLREKFQTAVKEH